MAFLFPCVQYSRLSKQYGMEIYLKKEHLHYTGSVAERGALYLLNCLTQVSRRRTHKHTDVHLDLCWPPQSEIVQRLLLTGDERWWSFWLTAPSVPCLPPVCLSAEEITNERNSKWMSFRFKIKVTIWLVDYNNTSINKYASLTSTLFIHTLYSRCYHMTSQWMNDECSI